MNMITKYHYLVLTNQIFAKVWTIPDNIVFRLVQDLGVDTQVAQHLSATYGDRAFSVGKMAQLTGMRWPIVGRRIHVDLPVEVLTF